MNQLNNTQRNYLRRLAHDYKPVVHVGKHGLSDQILVAVDRALTAHELIKVKFQGFTEEKQAFAERIAAHSASVLIMVIGNIAIFYRAHPEPARRRIILPAGDDLLSAGAAG